MFKALNRIGEQELERRKSELRERREQRQMQMQKIIDKEIPIYREKLMPLSEKQLLIEVLIELRKSKIENSI